jgi:hypothetical protein
MLLRRRYAHLAADLLKAANDLIGKRIAEAMIDPAEPSNAVVPLPLVSRRS